MPSTHLLCRTYGSVCVSKQKNFGHVFLTFCLVQSLKSKLWTERLPRMSTKRAPGKMAFSKHPSSYMLWSRPGLSKDRMVSKCLSSLQTMNKPLISACLAICLLSVGDVEVFDFEVRMKSKMKRKSIYHFYFLRQLDDVRTWIMLISRTVKIYRIIVRQALPL